MRGIVKWFNQDKGYGFIKSYEGYDVFVHISEVNKSGLKQLDEGQRVEFEVIENIRGKYAVKLINLWPI